MIKCSGTFTLLILIIITAFKIYPQTYYPEFQHISVEHGLSQSSVNCMLQDSRGFLWFGTKDGLNRYDGYSFKIYRNSNFDPESISDNYITALAEDQEGNILAGTLSGKINILNSNRHKIIVLSLPLNQLFSSLKNNNPVFPPCYSNFNDATITSICCGRSGTILAGTWGNGLFKYEPLQNGFTKQYFFSEDMNSVSSNSIMAITEDIKGNFWIGTFGGGLNKLKISIDKKTGEEKTEFSTQGINNYGKYPGNFVTGLIANNNSIFIGTYGSGLYRINFADNEQITKVTEGNDNITCLSSDISGNIWYGTFGQGIGKYDTLTGKFLSFVNNPSAQNSIDDNDIISIAADRSGLIWIGTFSGYGVNKLNPHKLRFNYFPPEPDNPKSLSDKTINSFTEDNQGNIWIGTYKGGLNKLNRINKSFEVFKNNPRDNNSIVTNYLTSVYSDRNNMVWIGTYDNGLDLYNPLTRHFILFKFNNADKNSINSNQITSVTGDLKGNIWVGTFNDGLNRVIMENGKVRFAHYMQSDLYPGSIPDNGIKGLFTGKDGNLWLITRKGSLCRYDYSAEEFIIYKLNDELSAELIAFYDAGAFVWLGTNGKGLIKFDKRDLKFVAVNSGNLNDRIIYGILEDGKNNLWLSSDNGLLKYNPANNSVISFNINDGLQSLQFINGACLKTHNGEMYFGGINGFNSFYPDSVKSNIVVPHPGITSVKVMNRDVPFDGNIIYLNYSQNSISISFSSFDFIDPSKNQYSYKLTGYDKNWNYSIGSNRTASYTNLPPGDYIFMLRSSDYAGIWNSKPVEFKIIIASPFYQRWWFILFVVLFISCLTGYLVLLKVSQYLALQKLKSKLSADLHDNIGSGLTEISLLSEVIQNSSSFEMNAHKNNIRIIAERSRDLVDNMSDIVWLVNPKNNSLKDLIIRLKDIYSPLCSSLEISFRLINIELVDDFQISMEKRQNIYLILKEGITNSLKYSGCRNLTLTADSDSRYIELKLQDDGHGFNTQRSFSGNGLHNMRKRADVSGAVIDISSIEGKGTIIYLKVNKKYK